MLPPAGPCPCLRPRPRLPAAKPAAAGLIGACAASCGRGQSNAWGPGGGLGETESRRCGNSSVWEAPSPLGSGKDPPPSYALGSQAMPLSPQGPHPTPAFPFFSTQGSRPGSQQPRLVPEWLGGSAATASLPSPSCPKPPCAPCAGSPHSVSLHALYSPSRLQPRPACRDLGAGERRAGP